MTTSYQVLCCVEMRHAYFTDGQLRELAAHPTPATAERLRRAGLLLKAQPTGFAVLYAGGGAPPAGLGSAFPLVFGLQPRSPYFGNYSDLPLVLGPAHTYCLGPPPQAPDPRLQTGPVVGAADQLPLRPLVFRQLVPAGAASAALSRHPGGPVLWQASVRPGTSLPLDLRAWGSGRYQLRLGEAAPEIFYADAELATGRPWGLLELGSDVLASPGTTYVLSFAARATYWQYQLVARRPPLPAGLLIDTGPAAIPFAEVPAPPGVAASLLAGQAQPLAERYAGRPYQLVLPEGGRPRILHPALPQAGPQALRSKNNSSERLLVTDIFVQL